MSVLSSGRGRTWRRRVSAAGVRRRRRVGRRSSSLGVAGRAAAGALERGRSGRCGGGCGRSRRQLGDDRRIESSCSSAECAYEQWHRLLFARFLAENDLLHPSAVPGAGDAWRSARSWPPSWVSRMAGRWRPVRGGDPAGHLPARRSVCAAAAGAGGPSGAGADRRRLCRPRSSRRTTRWGGCISSGRRTRRTRSTPRSARSVAPISGR